MNVLFLSPGYPPEMAQYVRGLTEVGANVFGVGDSPTGGLHPEVRGRLTDYLHVPRILDEEDVIARVGEWLRGRTVARIEAQWEVLVLLAARLRERHGVPGMSVDTVLGFRDKELMKARVAAAGLRVPRSARARTTSEAWAAAERIGFPLIIKPIAGAGSADTYRVDSAAELHQILARTEHVPEVSVEEFVDGEEFTHDTICVDGKPVFENVCQYLPRPLVARSVESISPIICTVRDLRQAKIEAGLKLGRGVLQALGMQTGFTHMEWYLKADGEVVFGEIGCRPGGAHLADQMNFTCDTDVFREWARAVCWSDFAGRSERLYNCAIVFKRARGQGRIQRIDGLDGFKRRHGRWLCWENLLPVGTQRRNWKATLLSDGFLIVRHPDWDSALAIAQDAADEIQMVAE